MGYLNISEMLLSQVLMLLCLLFKCPSVWFAQQLLCTEGTFYLSAEKGC